MKIKVDGDLLVATIKTLQKVVQVQALAIKVIPNFLQIVGVGNGNSCLMSCPCNIVEKSKHRTFTVGANNLLDALSKRKEVQLEIEDSALKVSSSRYAAELLVQPFEEVVVVPEEIKTSKDGIKLSDKFLEAIRTNLSKIELKPLMALYDYLPFGIKATKEGTFISCFDPFQSAFYYDKELKGDLEFTLPVNVFSVLAKEFKGQNYKLVVSDTSIYAFNDSFELAIARPQTEGQQITITDMLELFQSLKEQKGKAFKIVLKTEGINSMLENARSVYEKDSVFTFETKGDKCKLELKSSYGRVTSTVMLDEKPSKDVKFSCDFNFFSTLLSKAPATLELRVTDKLMMFVNKPVTYLLSLV